MLARTIQRVLVACRGQDAAAVCSAIEASGVEAVAIYADIDADAAHLDAVAYAARIASEDSGDPYADSPRIIAAALDSGADAVHAGVAGLARDGAFARLVLNMGLAFVGPRPDTLDACVDRVHVRQLAREIGVEPVPSSGVVEGELAAEHWIEHFGAPLLLRPARRARGGTRAGLRAPVLARTSAEARAALRHFRGIPLTIERAILPVRHLVVAVVGDGEGNVLLVGEHERSLRDRERVRVRECPAPLLADGVRSHLAAAARKYAAAAQILGVGSVEFLLGPDGHLWFHDFDPGLPAGFVVHDVAFGLSLAGAQIQIAAGESLGWDEGELVARRHAMELVLCATEPGDVEELVLPRDASTVLSEGAAVSPQRDPVLACVRVDGPTRSAALVRARAALESVVVRGVPHDVELLLRLCADPRMWEGNVSSSLLSEVAADETPPAGCYDPAGE